jgi:hypothetical protein
MKQALLVACALAFTACGGNDGDGSALLSGSVTGSFEGTAFVVQSGVLGKTNGNDVVALGTDGIDCASITASDPPKGHFASVFPHSLTVGSQSGLVVTVYSNVDSFHGTGSSAGTLNITAIDEDSITADIAYTDTVNGKTYALNGTFQVERCK